MTMSKMRSLAAALLLATLGAAIAAAPASARAQPDECSGRGFVRIINHVLHKYVWIKEKIGKHDSWRMMDCGAITSRR
jgi:ABC-type sugar transport system substrate-binding protein